MVNINLLLDSKNMSKYRLSKESGVPYSTIQDICSYKTTLPKCSAETVYKISKALDVSMECLLNLDIPDDVDYDAFRSNVSHSLRVHGDLDFMIDILEADDIRKLWDKRKSFESLYLLSTLDYLSRKHDIELCTNYNDIRSYKFDKPIFPSGILINADLNPDKNIKQKAIEEAIPEFISHGIVERSLYEAV